MDVQVSERIFTHADVRKGFNIGNDPEKIGEYTKHQGIIDSFLSNPNIVDENEQLLFLEYLDEDVCGRMFYFPTKIKIGDKIENSLGASSLYVSEKARDYSVGANLMMYPIKKKYKNYLLYAGVSKIAEPLYHKLLKFEWFDIPCMWQPRTSKFLFQTVGIKGVSLNILTNVTNLLLKPIIWYGRIMMKINNTGLKIEKLDIVPQWVEDIVLSDKHKYAEYHDKKWFEWVVGNNFFHQKYDTQGLYGVFKYNKPVGFFLIKERNVRIPEKNIDSVVFGSVIEWGTIDDSVLSEFQINKLAALQYTKHVDIVQVISTNKHVLSKIKKYMFFRRGNANIVFRDLTKSLDKDYKDINNWRIRVGYSDVPFY